MKYEQVNKEIVKVQRVTAPVGQMQLKSLIEAHVVSIFQFTETLKHLKIEPLIPFETLSKYL